MRERATSAELSADAVAAACDARIQEIADWRAGEREAHIVYLMGKKRWFSARWSRERAETEHEAECQSPLTGPDYLIPFRSEARIGELRALARAARGSTIRIDPDDFRMIERHFVSEAVSVSA